MDKEKKAVAENFIIKSTLLANFGSATTEGNLLVNLVIKIVYLVKQSSSVKKFFSSSVEQSSHNPFLSPSVSWGPKEIVGN